MCIRDSPDGYPIQLLSQDFDKHEELEQACREVVMDGAQQAMEDIKQDNNPITLEEAGLYHPSKAT